MATLNHAFDAQSLNGLATKIIKGRYPALDSKYSKNLKDLIAQMLSTRLQPCTPNAQHQVTGVQTK